MDIESEFDGCVVTFDSLVEKLEDLERQIGQKLRIKKHVRRAIIARMLSGDIEEDTLISQWDSTYSNYLEWVRSGDCEPAPLKESTAPPPLEPPMQQEAAQAASWLLWLNNPACCV